MTMFDGDSLTHLVEGTIFNTMSFVCKARRVTREFIRPRCIAVNLLKRSKVASCMQDSAEIRTAYGKQSP